MSDSRTAPQDPARRSPGHGHVGTILIVGASLAGVKAAEALRKEGYDGRIVMFGEDRQLPYLRPPLSKEYLRGEEEPDAVYVHPEAWYADERIELRLSTPVRAIETRASEVVLGDRERVSFDRLLIATGAASRRLSVPGGDLAGVHYLRTLEEAQAIRAAAASASRAVVIGGGWIGAEAAASLRQLGLPVAMVVPGSVPLERVLGTEVGAIYRDLHVERGVELITGKRAAAFRGTSAVEAVETADGASVAGDLVVVGIGAVPRIELAVAAGLPVGDGIHVDEHLETSVPGIFAAGDVAAAWHPVFGSRLRLEHWDNARRQGATAARNMLGKAEPYARIPYLYSDQYDLGMEYAGHATSWDRVVFRGEPASGSFIAFWLSEGRVVAGMNANVWKVNPAIGALVASQKVVDVGRLIDPAIPLDDLDGLSLPSGSAGA